MTHPKIKKTNYCTIHYDEDITMATVIDSWDSIVAIYFFHIDSKNIKIPGYDKSSSLSEFYTSSYYMQDQYYVAFVGKSGKIYLYSEHVFEHDRRNPFTATDVCGTAFTAVEVCHHWDYPFGVFSNISSWNTVDNCVTKYGDSVKAFCRPGSNKKEL
ncbi:hypothetical protein ABK040_013653 [Willaertia magna]